MYLRAKSNFCFAFCSDRQVSEASSSGVSDMSDGGSHSGSSGPNQTPRLTPSPGGSSCSVGVMSETSDYQRSTPSPGDDDIFAQTVAKKVSWELKVDEVKSESSDF